MFDDERVQTEIHGFQQKTDLQMALFFIYVNIEFTVEHWFIQSEINISDHGKFNEIHNLNDCFGVYPTLSVPIRQESAMFIHHQLLFGWR